MLGPLFVRLPVHARGTLVVDLHPVHAAVPLARIGIAGKYERQRDEAAGIARPALHHRIIEQRKSAGAHDLLTRRFGHRAWKERTHFGQLRKHLEFTDQAFGHSHFQILRNPAGDLINGVDL